jgi:hypothetical protein
MKIYKFRFTSLVWGEKVGREVVFRSTHYEVWREEGVEELVLASKYYCMVGYGNSITTYVVFNKVRKSVEVFMIRLNCNGTGRDELAYLELTNDEFNKLLELVRSVKTEEEFDKITEYVKEIEKRVEDEYQKRKDELIDELVSVGVIQEKLRSLKNEETRKELIEYLKEKIDTFLE